MLTNIKSDTTGIRFLDYLIDTSSSKPTSRRDFLTGILGLAALGTLSKCSHKENDDIIIFPTDTTTDAQAMEKVRQTFLADGSLSLANIGPKLIASWNYAEANYFVNQPINGVMCTFIKDPSQGNKMVSEGIGFWLRIATMMARMDTPNAAHYQTIFNQLLNSVDALIQLARTNSNSGNLMAWAFKIVGGVLQLDNTQSGPANSAADADLDVALALDLAQDNVNDTSIGWHNYAYDNYLSLYAGYLKVLFATINGITVTGPSEDWNTFTFGDYARPALIKLSNFFTNYGNATESAYWKNVGKGAFLEYIQNVIQTGNIPDEETIAPGTDTITITQLAAQGWEARGAMHWARGLYFITPNASERAVLNNFLATWNVRTYTVPELDAAMYLPLALALKNLNLARQMRAVLDPALGTTVYAGDPTRYFQMSLIMLAILEIYQPVPSTPLLVMP